MFHDICTEQIGLHRAPTWKSYIDNRDLHLVMHLSTKSGVSFQTAWAFAVILAALLSATYLDAASDWEQQLKTIYLFFVWSLLEFHPSKPLEETNKNTKVKIAHGGSHLAMSHMCCESYFWSSFIGQNVMSVVVPPRKTHCLLRPALSVSFLIWHCTGNGHLEK